MVLEHHTQEPLIPAEEGGQVELLDKPVIQVRFMGVMVGYTVEAVVVVDVMDVLDVLEE
jgi:hypothetical protein